MHIVDGHNAQYLNTESPIMSFVYICLSRLVKLQQADEDC